jgi:hypothetical protein
MNDNCSSSILLHGDPLADIGKTTHDCTHKHPDYEPRQYKQPLEHVDQEFSNQNQYLPSGLGLSIQQLL